MVVAIAVIAIGVVLYPLFRKADAAPTIRMTEEALDAQVANYQAALKSGTLCERCLSANAPGSKFCAECGRAL